MLIPHVTNDPSKVQLSRLAHVYFEHPNLNQFAKFATDFGFVEAQQDGDTIYYRGYGKDPYVYVASRSKDGNSHFGGPAFVAASEKEFNKAQKLPGAIFKTLDHAPGGGRMITIPRPGDTSMHIVQGQNEREVEDATPPSAILESQRPYNTPFEKPRRGTIYLRFQCSMLTSSRKVPKISSRARTGAQTRTLWLRLQRIRQRARLLHIKLQYHSL